MKLKEKLAEEYANEYEDFGDGPQGDAHLGFLAGFEKAREMAQSDLINHSNFCYENKMPEAGTHLRSSADSLNLLGEEEVT